MGEHETDRRWPAWQVLVICAVAGWALVGLMGLGIYGALLLFVGD